MSSLFARAARRACPARSGAARRRHGDCAAHRGSQATCWPGHLCRNDRRINPNFLRASDEPDAHGQVALLLTETFIHMLVERCVINNADSIEIVRTAAEVKAEVATAAGQSARRMKESLTLLARMQRSFEAGQAVARAGHFAARD